MSVRVFTKKHLQSLDLPASALDDKLIGTSRWSIQHEIIFQFEEKFYRTWYQVGATEYQDESPWEYDEEITTEEVELISKQYRNLNTLVYTPELIGNVGDRFRLELEFKTSILVDSSLTQLYQFTSTQISAPNFDFLAEGFRVGDEINIRVDPLSGGSFINSSITICI